MSRGGMSVPLGTKHQLSPSLEAPCSSQLLPTGLLPYTHTSSEPLQTPPSPCRDHTDSAISCSVLSNSPLAMCQAQR